MSYHYMEFLSLPCHTSLSIVREALPTWRWHWTIFWTSYVQLSKKYKHHVLLEHHKLPEVQIITQSCRHHPEAYTAIVEVLQLQYSQPHQLAQSEIAAILTAPDINIDSQGFQSFSLWVHLLVSILVLLEGPTQANRPATHAGQQERDPPGRQVAFQPTLE